VDITPANCPLEISEKECEVVHRMGTVRDFPNVTVLECLSCGVTFHGIDLSQEVNYPAGTMNDWPLDEKLALPVPDDDDKRRGEYLRNLYPTNRNEIQVLDFGSGRGSFLFELKDEFNVKGVEIELGARLFTKDLGFTVYESLEDLEKESLKFDVITLIHVVEHLYEPVEVLKRLSSLLADDGCLIIETPNADDALLIEYECEEFQNWTYWSHHPILYNFIGIGNLIRQSNLSIDSVESVQRYNLANHLYWLSLGKPGGHIYWKEKFQPEINKFYEQGLFQAKINDTIFIRASK